MSWRALRFAREEPDQVLRLQAFRAAHPDVIIGDGGFGVWQARILANRTASGSSAGTPCASCSTSSVSSPESTAPSSSEDTAQSPVADRRRAGDKESSTDLKPTLGHDPVGDSFSRSGPGDDPVHMD